MQAVGQLVVTGVAAGGFRNPPAIVITLVAVVLTVWGAVASWHVAAGRRTAVGSLIVACWVFVSLVGVGGALVLAAQFLVIGPVGTTAIIGVWVGIRSILEALPPAAVAIVLQPYRRAVAGR